MSDNIPSIHPAQYSKNLLVPIGDAIVEWLPNPREVREYVLLDPCAGLGHRLTEIAERIHMRPIGVEIERGYKGWQAPCVMQGDSTNLAALAPHFQYANIDAACTSVVYPNGMTDDFKAEDSSIRNTYAHRLRYYQGKEYRLHPNNAGGTNARRSAKAMERFHEINRAIYSEVFRVLRDGAPFIVNTKNTPYCQDFTDLTAAHLAAAGFYVHGVRSFAARGNNHGAHQHSGVKAANEDLIIAVKGPRGPLT